MPRNNNTDHQHNNLLHHHNTDDELTVNISEANSHLGNLLLESNWDEVLDYLTTPEGQTDVNANNDPLGLFNNESDTNLIPSRKNTAFFAALFVRAPYQVIQQIYTIGPSHVDEPIDLMYVLSIIPSEEEVRLSQLQKKSPHRTRTWTTQNEYHQLINLLLKALSHSSSLMDYWPSWIVGSTRNKMTPLAIAAYNPDVPANVVKLLCIAEPESIDKVCYLVHTLRTIIIAAASPIPSESSKEYENAKKRRWEKVKMLSLSKDYYYNQQKIVLKNAADDAIDLSRSQLLSDLTTPEPIEPQLEDIINACNQAIKHNEWELVREFLNHYLVDVKIQNALAQHDARAARYRKKQKKKQDREDWLHKNAGLLIYPIDAILDLISIILPPSKGEYHGIVSPMS